jgi:molecular chaperone DnaJ
MSKRDYYEVLGVPKDADDTMVKTAYRKLARQYHPDVSKASDASERFKEINEAYEVLSNPEKRQSYDRFGHDGPQAGFGQAGSPFGGFGGFGDVADIFDEFFGGFGGRQQQRGPARGTDLRYDMELTFQEAVFGVEKEIEVPRQENCPQCNGTGAEPGTQPVRCPQCNGTGEIRRTQQTILGQFVNVTVCPRCNGEREIVNTPCTKCKGQRRISVTRRISVNVPAGVDDGTRIRLAGEGEAGQRGGPAGSLYVVLHVKQHSLFERQDNDILLDLPVNIVQASLGAEMEIPTLDGATKITIPAGTQNGHVVRLRGKGVPVLRSTRRGDQLVTVRIVVPERLTEKQRKLLQELGESLGIESLGKDNRSLFERILDAVGDAFG